jgi:hypothetical protein
MVHQIRQAIGQHPSVAHRRSSYRAFSLVKGIIHGHQSNAFIFRPAGYDKIHHSSFSQVQEIDRFTGIAEGEMYSVLLGKVL